MAATTLRSTLRINAGFGNNLVLAGIGSLALAALAPLPTLAAPGISLQDSFTGSNGAYPYAALTAAGNGIYYGTTSGGGANGIGSIFAFDSGVPDANPAPGPLQLMGAGAAFGWSRRLRRRIQQVRPVFPISR